MNLESPKRYFPPLAANASITGLNGLMNHRTQAFYYTASNNTA
jgi:hypothetical protein